MTNWKLALTGTLMSLMMAATPAVSQELVKVGTFVPEKSVGVSRVIKPWMEAVSADVGGDVKLQGFWGGTLGKSPFKQFELVQKRCGRCHLGASGLHRRSVPRNGPVRIAFPVQDRRRSLGCRMETA